MKLPQLGLVLLVSPALALADSPASLPTKRTVAAAPDAPTPADAALPRPLVSPPPAWVEVAPLPAAPHDSEGAATIDLLGDVQVKFTNVDETTYYGLAWIIGTAAGLDSGSLKVDWDPSLETLTIHRYRLLREGRPIDLLGTGSGIKVIQRETRMESAMLDGKLTATLQPEDLRVGDVVELSYSVVRRDPAMKGFSEYVVGPSDGSTFGRFRMRMLWDRAKQMQWRVSPGILQPRLKKTAAGNELVADLLDTTAPSAPEGAPRRFSLVNAVEITEFRDWQSVSRTFAPLYADAARLAPDSAVRAEAAKIAAQTADPGRRAELALRLVQEQVRYLFLGMNAGGYVPAPAEQTWARRFGDCKGKTVLLLALLNELGVEARPVLVHSEDGDLVGSRLPAMGAFDHVIVEARIGGKSYWLDGTRLGDERLDRLDTPNYRKGLPVTAAGEGLVAIEPAPLSRPISTVLLQLDASKGLAVPAAVTAEMRFSGRPASDLRQRFSGYSQAERNRELRKVWRDSFDSFSPGKVGTRSDPETGDFVLTMTGSAQMEWAPDLGTRWYEIDRSRLGWRINIAREGEVSPDAPFAFEYPDWSSAQVTIKLPNKGAGFRLQGGSLDRTVGDLYHFRRTVAFVDGVVTLESETRALAGELPAARAPRARAEMAELASTGVYIRAPADYIPTSAEQEAMRRADEAEVKGASPARSVRTGG